VEAVTDPSSGLFLRVTAAPDHAAAAKQLLQRFPVKIEVQA
jgi:fatty-acyl-CoA synthase